MKLGRTIVAARDGVQTESERAKMRVREARKKRLMTVLAVLVMLGVAIAVVLILGELIRPRQAVLEVEQKFVPTVTIIDEDGSGYITDKMKEYVGRIERDFYDLGYKVTKVIVPTGKAREMDIYLDGREEYYKCNLDRGTAETAEDAVRMVKYLVEKQIQPKYVDVRIEEKAFYL